jgi:tetratricopeptide (TPR) repeat protein
VKPAEPYIIPILLITALALTACAPKETTGSSNVEKPAAKQARPIGDMPAPFLYLAAQNAIKDRNPNLAIKLLEALTQKDPTAIEPRQQLTELLLQKAQFDKANTHVDILLENKDLTPKQLELMSMMKARALVGKGSIDEALEVLNAFLDQHPVNIPARDLQIRILSSQKRIDEALIAINEAIRTEDLAEFRLLQSQLLINKGDTDGAKLSLQRLQELGPDNATVAIMLSSIALKENNQKLAEEVLRNFLDSYPDSLPAGNALGSLLAQQNRLAEAIIVYRNIAAQTSNDPAVLQTLGLLYLQFKEYKQAEETFRKLYETRSNDSNRFYLAASLEALERDDEARKIYVLIDKKAHLYTDAQMRLAGMDFRQDDLNAAEQRVKSVLRDHPRHPNAHLLLSAIRINQKKYRLLLDESEPVIAVTRLPPQLLLNRAVAFDHFKEYKQAEAMLKRILAHYPKHSESLNFLGYIYALQGVQLSEAEALIKRALVHKPNDGYYMDSLAWVYYKNSKFAKALRTQKKALEIITDDAVMYEHIGDILWRTGDKNAARNAWRKSIELKSDHPLLLKRKIAKGLKKSE